MKIIKSDHFQVSIPKKYKVKKHYPYIVNLLFFTIIRFIKVWSELTKFIKKNPPDLKLLKGFRSYEVKMEKHSFIFYTEFDDKEPSDLARLIEDSTRHLPTLEDIQINGVKGKKHGSYSEYMSWIDWWLKKDDCMICLNFQGEGMPSDEIKEDVSNILDSLEYIP